MKPVLPKAVEMPEWSLERRLQWALRRTENEGFARSAVGLLRKHQPKSPDGRYPAWWDNVSFYVRDRAYLSGPSADALKIVGPYLDDYAAVAVEELERELAGKTHGFTVRSHGCLNLLLKYLEYKPKSPVRQRLETLARRHAKIPPDAPPARPSSP